MVLYFRLQRPKQRLRGKKGQRKDDTRLREGKEWHSLKIRQHTVVSGPEKSRGRKRKSLVPLIVEGRDSQLQKPIQLFHECPGRAAFIGPVDAATQAPRND